MLGYNAHYADVACIELSAFFHAAVWFQCKILLFSGLYNPMFIFDTSV